jgi:hypothetical protein
MVFLLGITGTVLSSSGNGLLLPEDGAAGLFWLLAGCAGGFWAGAGCDCALTPGVAIAHHARTIATAGNNLTVYFSTRLNGTMRPYGKFHIPT